MKHLLFLFILFSALMPANGQTAAPAFNFIEYQRTFPRISEALKRKEDILETQFRQKGLQWPAKNIYLRSFKFDSQLEVWVKGDHQDKYQLFKVYKVCALAGTLGPKRMRGDYQVPEGFYYINEFNPNSAFYLSLGLNYPNSSDRMLADSLQPGGDIYIHGKCVTTGCIPIMDDQIEDLYILAAHAHSQGQDFIPVHIFPVDFKNPRSEAYLAKYIRQFPEYIKLSNELKQAYNYFDKTKKLPLIMVNGKGEYVVGNTTPVADDGAPEVPAKKERRPIRQFNEARLAKVYDALPVYPGGNQAFKEFIDGTSKEMSAYLKPGQSKTYVMMEFIIDRDGTPAYAKVIQGGNDELNDALQEKFENMPTWKPATRSGLNVAVKLKQSMEIIR
jgi:murein L,D-transpeptidase YafK